MLPRRREHSCLTVTVICTRYRLLEGLDRRLLASAVRQQLHRPHVSCLAHMVKDRATNWREAIPLSRLGEFAVGLTWFLFARADRIKLTGRGSVNLAFIRRHGKL